MLSPGDTEEDPGLGAVRIHLLADRPDLIPVVAGWHWNEWGHGDPTGSPESWADGLRASVGRANIPIDWVALLDGEPIGTAALREHDMATHPELSPWFSSLFVVPRHRGRGIASALLAHTERAAASLGVETLYLYTTDAEALYARRGWHVIAREPYGAETVAIMARRLRAP